VRAVRVVQVGPGPAGLSGQLVVDRDAQRLGQPSVHSPSIAALAIASVFSASLTTAWAPSGRAIASARRASSTAAGAARSSRRWLARLAYAQASSCPWPSGSSTWMAASAAAVASSLRHSRHIVRDSRRSMSPSRRASPTARHRASARSAGRRRVRPAVHQRHLAGVRLVQLGLCPVVLGARVPERALELGRRLPVRTTARPPAGGRHGIAQHRRPVAGLFRVEREAGVVHAGRVAGEGGEDAPVQVDPAVFGDRPATASRAISCRNRNPASSPDATTSSTVRSRRR